MTKCFDHKTNFLDTHRYFRPAIETYTDSPIISRGPELKKSNLKTNMLGFAAYVFEQIDFRKVLYGPHEQNSKGYRMHNSELRLHLNCAFDNPCFLHVGYKMHF